MILTLSGITAAIMFFLKKHKLLKHYFTQCEPCATLHLSIVVYFLYLLMGNYGIEIEPLVVTNPITIWITGFIGFKFLWG